MHSNYLDPHTSLRFVFCPKTSTYRLLLIAGLFFSSRWPSLQFPYNRWIQATLFISPPSARNALLLLQIYCSQHFPCSNAILIQQLFWQHRCSRCAIRKIYGDRWENKFFDSFQFSPIFISISRLVLGLCPSVPTNMCLCC